MNQSDTAFGGTPIGSEAGDESDGLTVDRASELLDLPRSERFAALFDFQPFGYQATILDTGPRRKVWVAGRQVGKTETAGAVPADWVLTHPGEDALIAAEYQETADELFARTKDHFASIGEPGTVGVDKPNTKTYTLDTGGRVLSRTIGGGGDDEGNTQRGKVPSCVVVEEAAIPSEDVFDQVIRPMFATHDEYELWLISTPRGKSGYLYEKWNQAEGERWGAWRTETAECPLVSDEWLAEMKDDVDTLTFDQEYRGRFVETGDEYLPPSLVDPRIGPKPVNEIEAGDGARYLGVDPARSGEDRSVYTSVDAAGNVFALQALETETVPEAVRRIKALNREHGYRRIYVDENGLGGGVVDYSDEGLSNVTGVAFTLSSKADMYKNLKTAFERGDVTLPAGEKRLRNEVTSLTFDFSQSGKLQVSHPPGEHDDYPDSLALAMMARRDGERAADRSVVDQRENPPGLHSRNRGRSGK